VLVLPAGATVQFDLESIDVVHSFWLTVFRFKRDAIPGSPSSFRVDMDDTTGFFPNAGVCAEFCGLDHALMRFSVRILPPAEFDAWLDERQEEAP
jgi:cytochrome c oxidase subunit II